MNVAKGLSILGLTICMVLMVTTGGCKKSADGQLVPSGVLLQSDGCKQFLANAAGQMDSRYVPGQYEDCLEYQYNGTDTLTLRHINAEFNCCPGEITAIIGFSENVITINEVEAEQDCDCRCLYDLDYEVVNLAPGEYTIRVIEVYVNEYDQALEFTLLLFSTTSGTYCVQR